MFLLHHSPNHNNGVIALRQDKVITLIWCDSMQYEGSSALQIYAQYYHFVEGLTRPQAFKQPRHYTSLLDIRRRCPRLPHQENGTDCGIFTLMYQQALSKWYGRRRDTTLRKSGSRNSSGNSNWSHNLKCRTIARGYVEICINGGRTR